MDRCWTVWYFAVEADHPKCHTVDSEGEAVEWKRRLLRSGVECVVIVNPRNEVTDCERQAETVSLDDVLGRGRHGGPEGDGPTAA